LSLQIVYGRAGSGKTTACFEIIKKIMDTDGRDLLYIVPEQYSLQTERKILTLGAGSRVDVLSFARLAQRVFSRVGPVYGETLGDAGKQMMLRRALFTLKNKLTVLSSACETEGFCKTLADTVGEFKRHGVTPSDLLRCADGLSGALKLKITDLALIYEAYNSQLSGVSRDADDDLAVLPEKIAAHGLFSDAHVILDSFNGFLPNQIAVVTELLRRAVSVTVTLATDSLVPSENIADIFYASKRTASRLFAIAAEHGVTVLPNIFTGECKKYRANAELAHLEKNFFKYPAEIYANPAKNLGIFMANNYYGEVEAAAVYIRRLCRESGYRFREIAVVTKAMEVYAPLARHIFSEYEIFFHTDEKYNALQHPFTRAVLSLFDIVIHNFNYEAVFTWLKSEYCGAELCQDDIFLLENYVLARGNTPKLWKSPDDWTFLPNGFTQGELDAVNAVKNAARRPLVSFTERFRGRKTVREISAAFTAFLYETGADKRVEEKVKTYRESGEIQKSNAQTAVWNALITTIDSMVSILGGQQITFEKYYAVLTAGLEGCEIGQIPPAADEVQICPVDRFKGQDVKCVIVLGVTNGVFPASYTNEGLLSDSDRHALSDTGVTLADDTVVKQAGENYVVYAALTAPLEKLFLFYPIADNEGKALYPSTIIERVSNLFPAAARDDNVFDKPDILPYTEGATPAFHKMLRDGEKYKEVRAWFAARQPERLRRAASALNYTNLPRPLSTETARRLYGDVPKGSVSRAEQYHRCRYAYFLKYGLNAKERERYSIEPTDAGTFMHEVIEAYSAFADAYGWDGVTRDLCAEKIDALTQAVFENRLSEFYTSSPRFCYLSKKVKRIMSTTAWNITEFYKQSPFVPLGYEIAFGTASDGGASVCFPPIEVEACGVKIPLRGKVDRADVLRTESGNYVSIVDYKSSGKSIDFSELLCGIQIQLPVYIKAVCDALTKKEGVRTLPAAMLYYKFDAPVIAAEKGVSEEELLDSVRKSLKMRGIFLESEKIAEGINPVFAVKSSATAEQLDKVCKTAYKQLQSAFAGIISGNIAVNPVRVSGKTACDWCPYGSVCRFDAAVPGNKYRSVKTRGKEEFFSDADSMD
jgi:ATP-dependent helicase/nuclease subunit B